MVIKINYTSSDVYVSTSVSPVYVVVNYSAVNNGGGAIWGGITGTLSDQTDLQDALDDKVPYTGATANVNLGEYELKAGQMTLDTTPTGTAAVGTTRWNDTIGSSETTLKGGSVILKNGVDLVARVVNKVSPNTTLTKAAYQAVRVSGAQGQRLAVALAQANNDANSADTIGLVTETINANQEGFIMTVGQLENINTTGSLQGETWADGDVLYLSPTTAGAITKVKPTGNGHIVVIGYVEYAHQNNGKIYVKVMNGWELDELHDVSIVSPANNEALIYESSTSLWKNKTIATALGYTPISGSGTSGQVAYWNGTSSQTGSNNLFWDAANARLGIAKTPASPYKLDVNGAIQTNDYLMSPAVYSNGAFQLGVLGGTVGFRLTTTLNTQLFGGATPADSGQRLQVNGDAFIKGSGATSATSGLVVQDSAGTQIFNVRNDGAAKIGAGSFGHPTSTRFQVNDASGNQLIRLDSSFLSIPSSLSNNGTGGLTISGNTILTLQPANANNGYIIIGGGVTNSVAYTNDTRDFVFFNQNWNAVAGSSNLVRNVINLNNSINFTNSTGTNIARGIYINPTLTSVSDFRAIEWSNNTGWGLYGAGTANNYLGGALGIGTTSPSDILDIRKNQVTTNVATTTSVLLSNTNASGIAAYVFTSDGTTRQGGLQYNNTTGFRNLFSCTYTNIPYYFGTNSLIRLTITGDTGNILVNTTTDAGFKIDVNGTARILGQTTTQLSSNAGSNPNLLVETTNGESARLQVKNSEGSFSLQTNDNTHNITNSNTAISFQDTIPGVRIASGSGGAGSEGNMLLISGTKDSFNNNSRGIFINTILAAAQNNTNLIGLDINPTFTPGAFSNVTSIGLRVQIGGAIIGGTALNASAHLQVDSTTQGFLPPRMTNAQRTAISSPAVGLIVYCTDATEGLYVYKSTGWTFVI